MFKNQNSSPSFSISTGHVASARTPPNGIMREQRARVFLHFTPSRRSISAVAYSLGATDSGSRGDAFASVLVFPLHDLAHHLLTLRNEFRAQWPPSVVTSANSSDSDSPRGTLAKRFPPCRRRRYTYVTT